MRSLTLDSLSDSEAKLLLALGNEKMNCIFQQTGQDKYMSEEADRDMRMKWIRSKYVQREFILDEDVFKDQETC